MSNSGFHGEHRGHWVNERARVKARAGKGAHWIRSGAPIVEMTMKRARATNALSIYTSTIKCGPTRQCPPEEVLNTNNKKITFREIWIEVASQSTKNLDQDNQVICQCSV
jgi:hypothetical protein